MKSPQIPVSKKERYLLRFFGWHKVRESAQSTVESLDFSANSTSGSGYQSLTNYRGCLETVQQLSKVLNDAIAVIEADGNLRTTLHEYEDDLDAQVSEYANYSLDSCASKQPWSCTPDVADLITIVWNCAARAYEEDHTVPIGSYDIREVDRIKQSWAGSTKETVFTLVKSCDDDSTEPGAEFPVLVVAIRGSSAFADFMVDLNQRPTRATDFLSSEFEVHAGFIAAARSLHPELLSRIEKLCDEHDIDRVVFTGHSAGAAVASLLFLHFRMHGTNDGRRFSCISFGGPPVLKTTVSEAMLSGSDDQLWLNIITEFDMVSRVDKLYIHSLFDMLKQGPPSSGDVQRMQGSKGGLQNLDIPAGDFRQCGDIVIFQKKIFGHRSLYDPSDTWKLAAHRVSWTDFSQLLFPRFTAHAREVYCERIERVSTGDLTSLKND